MTTRISYDTSKPHGSVLSDLVDETLECLAGWKRLKAAADSMASGADYQRLADEFGIATSTEGQTVYNIITNIVVIMDVYGVNNLAVLDQG